LLPKEILDWYHENYNNSDVRLRHAEELARRGIDGIWLQAYHSEEI
jgi:hypothetical protein